MRIALLSWESVHFFAVGALITLAGCDVFFLSPFAPGSYANDVSCVLLVAGESGEVGSEQFDIPVTLAIDGEGNLEINGEEVVVGAQVSREIPTAEMTFEVTEVVRHSRSVMIGYEPRPTLPGISVDGHLMEIYRWHAGAIEIAVVAGLELTDISTTSLLTVDCLGTLPTR